MVSRKPICSYLNLIGDFKTTKPPSALFVFTSKRPYTVDPQNIQTILSTNARDYCIGQSRIRALRPLLGGGALAATEKPSKRSRILLKHGLTRIQAVNYQLYERHFTRLLEQIRIADETVDLQELFFSMVRFLSTARECRVNS